MVGTVTLSDALGQVPTPTSITTGATPIDADPTVLAYAVTTGGTGGQEVINLPNFTGPVALSLVGRRITIAVPAALTNPADSIKITVGAASSHVNFYTASVDIHASAQQYTDTGVILSQFGNSACFVWGGREWFLDVGLSNTTTVSVNRNVNVFPVDALAGSNTTGSDVFINGGTGDGTSAGGNVWLGVGYSNGTGPTGNVMVDIPTVDPHVSGALWNNVGVLTVSAG